MASRSHFDASDALHEFACFPCSEDGKNTEALYHCKICQTFYCQRCVAVHNKFTKNHNVTDKNSDTFGQKLGKTVTQFSNDLPTDVCEEHHGEVVKMFCGYHDLVCCTICIAVKHRSCEGVEYIPNIASGLLKRQGKNDIKTSLQSVKADLENLKSKVENELKRMEKQRDGFIEDIQEFKQQIIARVAELERNSLDEVKSKHKELTDIIDTYNKKIDDLLKVIDTRLNKLAQDNNDAQTFVEVKNGEKELSEGTNLAKQTAFNLKDAKPMEFKKNTDIEEYLSKIQYLGSLKEHIGKVNIACPFETRITVASISELQSQLQSYDIQSECTKASEIVAGRYTIVLCENNDAMKALELTKGFQDDTIILMRLIDEHRIYVTRSIQRNVKANFMISYTEERRGDKIISFANHRSRNKQKYELISEIVIGHK